MRLRTFIYLLVLLSLVIFLPAPSAMQTASARPFDITEWVVGLPIPDNFQYARHDGAFVPGPTTEPWANKVYFPGGRTSPPTESPHIWMFDPATQTYTDTGADVVEDVSNYNANLVMDDGTGRGPAIYVIGGTDKDHGGVTIGLVQRYYPELNIAESLPAADNWNGRVGNYLVAAVGSAVVNDIIYVYGGWETGGSPYFSVETWTFDPKQATGYRWTNLTTSFGIALGTARSYIMSAVQDGKIYAIGGVGFYNGSELNPTDAFEVLDPANLAAGWQQLTPMPIPGGEGRAFGFDSDTINASSPYAGKIYVVASNDWAAVSGEVMAYDVAAGTWNHDLPELPTPRADLAASFIPLCSAKADAHDGLPGLWTFGGRVNESCDPPLGPAEFAPLECLECSGITGVEIDGPTILTPGEVGTYAAIVPDTASVPVALDWDNGTTGPETTYSWDTPGTYTVTLTGTNCEGTSVVIATLTVEVSCINLASIEIYGPDQLRMGEVGQYLLAITPENATPPLDILWSNGSTNGGTTYSWDTGGLKTVSVTAINCSGSASFSDEMLVNVSYLSWLPMVARPIAR